MKRFSFFCLFLFAAFAAFFDVSMARAQQNNPFEVAAEGLTLSPPSFEMTLKPGEETAYTIQVTNPTKNLIELYPSAGNFTASGDDGQPKYEIGTTAIENTSAFSIASWIAFYTPKVALLPEQVVDFKFRIKVPDNAEPGGHYGIVFLGTKPPEEKDQKSQVALSSMVGSLLLVRVPGDVREESHIEEFSAPWFFFTPPVNFSIFLRNTGNIHIRPQGEIALTDWRGQTIDRMDINPKKGGVLPESRRNFDIAWRPDISHFWNIPVGKFRATLTVIYGQSSKTLSQQIAFWVIPKWLIITVGIFFALLIICIIFLIIRRRRKKRLQRNHSTPQPPRHTTSNAPEARHRLVYQYPSPPPSTQYAQPSVSAESKPDPYFPASPSLPTPPQNQQRFATPVHQPTPLPPRSPQEPHQQTSQSVAPQQPTAPSRQWLNRITASNETVKENKKNMRF